MYIMCVCLFSVLSRRVGALQIFPWLLVLFKTVLIKEWFLCTTMDTGNLLFWNLTQTRRFRSIQEQQFQLKEQFPLGDRLRCCRDFFEHISRMSANQTLHVLWISNVTSILKCLKRLAWNVHKHKALISSPFKPTMLQCSSIYCYSFCYFTV